MWLLVELLRILSLTMAVLCFMWHPLLQTLVLQYTYIYDDLVYWILGLIVFVNTCVNPFIYCFKYEAFQDAIKQMFCGKLQGSNDESAQSTQTSHTNWLYIIK